MPWKDPEVARIKTKEYRDKNREKIARRARERYAENPHNRRAHNLRSLMKQRYGITLEDKAELLAKQGNKCAICGTDTPNTPTGWHIDHCHETNKIRGILCQQCNNMLGNAKDSAETLRRAAVYLEEVK